jgi:hypothetical protein
MDKPKKSTHKPLKPSAGSPAQAIAGCETQVALAPAEDADFSSGHDGAYFANLRNGPNAVGLLELASLFDEMEHILLAYSGGPAKEEMLRQIVGVEELETLRFVLIIQALKARYGT